MPFKLRRAMEGGLYFGQAPWTPDRLATGPLVETRAPGVATPDMPSLANLMAQISASGLTSTDQWTPPLEQQLARCAGRVMRAIVLNCIPESPESNFPLALFTLDMANLLAGLAILKHAAPHRATIIACDRHDHGLGRRLKVVRRKQNVRIMRLINRYPQAHPTVLLRSMFGSRLPVDALPTDVGVLLVDPVACWALGRFVRFGIPVTHRPVEVFRMNAPPVLGMAEIGAPLAGFLRDCQAPYEGQQCILNGMLTGTAVDPAVACVTMNMQSISLRATPVPEFSYPCIRCGWCVDHCPTGLNPARLFQLAPRTTADLKAQANNCVGCGLCSYVCPSRLPLAATIVRLRADKATV